MKIWYQHGSEHSANLVMIGRFSDEAEASKVKEILDAIAQQVSEDERSGKLIVGSPSDRYSDEMLDLLGRLSVHSITPQELEQFMYEVDLEVDGSELIVTTEEIDVSSILKVMINAGARIEVYSAHHHEGTGHGRGS